MTQKMPEGWTAEQVKAVADFYDSQDDTEAAAELDAAWTDRDSTMVQIPRELLPVVRKLLAEHERSRPR